MARPETLPEMLGVAGIKVKSMHAGATMKAVCPTCHGGRHREQSLSVTIDADGQGFVANCHRGTCGWTHGAKVSSKKLETAYRPAPRHEIERVQHPSSFFELFKARGIGEETLEHFGCYVLTAHKFPGDLGAHDAIVFPYRFENEVVNRKYRALASKEITAQEYQAMPTLFNVDAVESPDVVYWVEGEPDVLALHEAGYRQVVSLKDGAPAKARELHDPRRETDKRFEALSTHAGLLEGVQKFVLAGDMDAPGMVLREELARRLGRHRCWTVTWPEGCKDGGDALRKGGPEMVCAAVEAAEAYPVDGVQEVTGDMLDRYLELPAPPVMTTGVREVDAILRLPGEGRVIVVTGFPNAGKTPWTMNVMVHLMRHYDRRFLVFSPEMQPLEEFLVMVSEILVGKPARNTKQGVQTMSRDERKRAGAWLHGRMSFLSSDAENHIPSLEWVLERARDKALRSGITDLLIDPWNELEQSNGKELTETQFIGQGLQRVNAFALRHGCNVWIVAHPAKPPPPQNNAKPTVPNGYSISGSAHWFNKCALGITVHRPDELTQIHIWKAKFKRHGKKGDMAEIEYDMPTGRYVSPSLAQGYADREVA